MRNYTSLIAIYIVVFLSGCVSTRQQPPPLAPAGILTQERTYRGTPLSGPLADALPATAGQDSLAVRVSFFALEKMPGGSSEPLSEQVRMIVSTKENSPVLAAGRLTGEIRLIEPEGTGSILSQAQAGRFGKAALIWTDQAPLLPGATVDFAVTEPGGLPDVLPGEVAARRIGVDLYRAASASGTAGVGAAVSMDGYVNTAPPRDIEEAFVRKQAVASVGYGHRDRIAPKAPVEAPAPPPVLQSEIAVFERPPAPDSFALAAPMQLDNSLAQAVLVVVEISPPPSGAAYDQLVSEARGEIERSSRDAAAQAKLIGVEPPDWPGLSSAVESLAFAGRQRAGLLFLSQQTNAQITQDVTFSADDAVVSQLAAAIGKAIVAATSAKDRATVGWICERTTLRLLMQYQSGGKLPPELAAILANRAGQAGRNSGTLEEVLSNATGRVDMENRLAAENYIFLEDSSPSARVRAFDWLTARHLAPPGYDPLGQAKQRRDALEQAEQASSANPGPGK